MARATSQVSYSGKRHSPSSTAPSQSSSRWLPHSSGALLATSGSRSLQSAPSSQFPSTSPSPSASRGSRTQDRVSSSQRSIVQGVRSEQLVGGPAVQPIRGSQRSTPLQ